MSLPIKLNSEDCFSLTFLGIFTLDALSTNDPKEVDWRVFS